MVVRVVAKYVRRNVTTQQPCLELTFHKPSKRWCKVIEAKRYYFGGGRSRSDRKSYYIALSEYRVLQTKRLHEKQTQLDLESNEQLGFLMTEAFDRINTQLDPTNRTLLRQVFTDITRFNELEITNDNSNTNALFRRVIPDSSVPENESLDLMLDQFASEQRKRYEKTRQNPDSLSRKERLGGSGFRNQSMSLDAMRTHFRAIGLVELDDMPSVEQALLRYRKTLDDRVERGEIQPSTIGMYVKAVRPFFTWAWKQRRIRELPRCLDEATKRCTSKPDPKPLAITTIRRLWAQADERLRCWIALGLNCGFYAADIATMQPGHLVKSGKYLARYRHKTGIPTKHLLWPMTQELIRRCRTSQGKLLFIRKKDVPLIVESSKDAKRYDSIANRLKRIAMNAGVKATFSQLRDTSADRVEYISATGPGIIDRALTDQFLGHHDPRMARFYSERKPSNLETSKLDTAIRKLDTFYGLKL